MILQKGIKMPRTGYLCTLFKNENHRYMLLENIMFKNNSARNSYFCLFRFTIYSFLFLCFLLYTACVLGLPSFNNEFIYK